jgi:2-(1,2-epoxy-1,2-dihydrophenyl)acetyl-CoA isomerase
MLTAAEAFDWGIVNRVVPDDALAQEAEGLARSLAAGPTLAFGRVKDLILHCDDSLESQMERETRVIADSARTADAKEGIRAFLEKRKASFAGK